MCCVRVENIVDQDEMTWSEAIWSRSTVISKHDIVLNGRNLSTVVGKQQACRPACASRQSDQRLCYLLIAKYHI